MSMKFKIDKNIKIPITLNRVENPLPEMEVGDSWAFSGDIRNFIQQSASQLKRRAGKTFCIRKQPDGSCRIWRIK